MQKLQHVGLGLGGKVLGVLGPIGMIGDDRAACAGGDDLVAIEAVAADISDGTGKLALEGAVDALGTQGLGSVLDQNQAVAAGDGHQAGHIGHVAEDMHSFQRLDMGTGGLVVQFAVAQFAVVGAEVLNSVGVDAKAVVAADEDGFCADVAGQRVDSGDEGQGRDDDFIPAGNAGSHSGQVQGAGTGVAGHGAGHAHVVGQRFLKLGDFAAAGGDPAGGDSLAGKLCFAGAEIRDRKRNKFRHDTASQTRGAVEPAAWHSYKNILFYYTAFGCVRQVANEKQAACLAQTACKMFDFKSRYGKS